SAAPRLRFSPSRWLDALTCSSAYLTRVISEGAPRPLPPNDETKEVLRAELVDDGEPPVFAEGAGRDLDADGPLPPLVLVAVDHGDHPLDRLRVEAARHDVGHALVPLDVAFQDGVQLGVWRQGVLVRLVRAQLGRGRPREDRLRDQLAPRPRVGVLAQLVDERLRAVLDDREAPRHVAVERGVSDGDLALVAG